MPRLRVLPVDAGTVTCRRRHASGGSRGPACSAPRPSSSAAEAAQRQRQLSAGQGGEAVEVALLVALLGDLLLVLLLERAEADNAAEHARLLAEQP